MTSTVLSGKELASKIRATVIEQVQNLAQSGITVKLAVVVANDDESSAWYVRSIARAASKVDIVCEIHNLGADASVGVIKETLTKLSSDSNVHGIIMQTPLPAGIKLAEVASSITITKDIDGANPENLGRLMAGLPAFAPATAHAVEELLVHHNVQLARKHAVVVGRSTVVGKPAAHLLLNHNATVTICHSRTADLATLASTADVLVAAIGKAEFVTAEHVKPGATVIDVGTNPTEDGGLVGDVNSSSVGDKAGALTPVPGGVGPVTTALLLQHTVQAANQTIG